MRVKEDKRTDESERRQTYANTVWQRKHKWLGHVLHHEVLLRHIIEE